MNTFYSDGLTSQNLGLLPPCYVSSVEPSHHRHYLECLATPGSRVYVPLPKYPNGPAVLLPAILQSNATVLPNFITPHAFTHHFPAALPPMPMPIPQDDVEMEPASIPEALSNSSRLTEQDKIELDALAALAGLENSPAPAVVQQATKIDDIVKKGRKYFVKFVNSSDEHFKVHVTNVSKTDVRIKAMDFLDAPHVIKSDSILRNPERFVSIVKADQFIPEATTWRGIEGTVYYPK